MLIALDVVGTLLITQRQFVWDLTTHTIELAAQDQDRLDSQISNEILDSVDLIFLEGLLNLQT